MARVENDKPVDKPVATRPKVGVGEPGYALGVAGFITSFFAGLVGLVLSIIALSQSRRVGKKNTFALAGIIIGAAQIVVGILAGVLIVTAIASAVTYCRDNPDARACSSQQRGYDDGPSVPRPDDGTY